MRKPLFLLLTLAAASLPASASPGVIDLPSGNFSATAPQKPVRNVDEVRTIVGKSINYEANPVTTPSFYSHAAHFAYFEDDDGRRPDGVEDARYTKTAEDIRNYMVEEKSMTVNRLYKAVLNNPLDPPMYQRTNPECWSKEYSNGDSIPAFLRAENGFAWSANADSIVNAINDGRLYFLYRGHGWPEGFCLISPDSLRFGNKYVQELNNYRHMPLMFNITCDTGKHDRDDCFTRNLLAKENGGTMAVFAQTNTGYSGFNDKLTSLMFNAIWPNPSFELDKYPILPYISQYAQSLPMYRLGEILDFGINGMETTDMSDTSTDLYIKRVTHCFADPSISFTTAVPAAFGDITVTNNGNTVTVDIGNEPAYISFHDPMTSESHRFYGTEASYSAYDAESLKYVDITVSGHNKIPYVRQGNYYYDTNINSSRIVGRQNMGHSRATVDVMISPTDKGKSANVLIVDMTTGRFI